MPERVAAAVASPENAPAELDRQACFYLRAARPTPVRRPRVSRFAASLTSSAGGIGLRDGSGALVGSVGYGATAANAFVEGTPGGRRAGDRGSRVEHRPQAG